MTTPPLGRDATFVVTEVTSDLPGGNEPRRAVVGPDPSTRLGLMMKLEDADLFLQKVGTIGIMYYPDMPVDSPRYRLDDDIDWCVASLPDDAATAELRELAGRTIVDPTAHREALTAHVYGLVPGAAEADG